MTRNQFKVYLFLAVLTGMLTLPLHSFAAEKIWGTYKNNIDDNTVHLSIFPLGADETSGKASVIFNLVEKNGRDLEMDGTGIIKGQTVVLYYYGYRLTATISGKNADFLIEESCEGNRFYEGYSHYSNTCQLYKFKSLPIISKGLTRR